MASGATCERGAALARFMEEVAAIGGMPASRVRPESRLVADLGLELIALARLDLLLFERYGVRETFGGSAAGGEEPTVEAIFDAYLFKAKELRR